ncbi:MAG: hypothetical protein J0H67_10205 [Rhodospirillales bacterium]|nr:hypothetical protein [Rhodospirillales bacterium]MBN8898733.1 hypothetical protein [Rhodospirillales bacterium]MBN8905440.1 hypothetical protein [Rhodospirillales bacterium]
MIEDANEPLRPALIDLASLQLAQAPADFGFTRPSDADLERYLLPPRPDPRARQATANWERALAPPLRLLSGAVGSLFQATTALRIGAAHPVGGPTQESSRNWSGGMVRPPHGRFVSVEAEWVVTPPAPPPRAAADGEYRASTWIGLDGHDPASPTLAQIGTLQRVTVARGGPPQVEVSAWWQWWLRDVPGQHPVVITGLPLAIDDHVYAKITLRGPSTARFFMRNLTNGVGVGFEWNDPDPLHSVLEGLTAEWIVERPTRVGTTLPYTLPNYRRVTMTGCVATLDAAGGGGEHDLRGASLIRLVDWEDDSSPGAIVSTPIVGADTTRLALQYGDLGP